MRGAVGIEQGYWGPLLVPGEDCLSCFEAARRNAMPAGDYELERVLPPTPWSFGVTNTIVSAWLVHDIVEQLCGRKPASPSTRIFADFAAARISQWSPAALAPCPHVRAVVPS